MVRAWSVTVFAALLLGPAAAAQTARFHWQAGQVLTYRVEQVTSATDVAGDSKVATTTKLRNTKRWQVLAVDPHGTATVQLSLLVLRIETTTPSGEVLLFDSASPDQSTPQLRAQLSQYVGTSLAVLRVDSRGNVVEVKDSQHGPASRFESEPPFVLTLPEQGPGMGQTWQRSYKITLEPPQGTGEKYDAVQQYVCKSVTADTVSVGVTTVLKAMPESLLDRVPLLQMQPEGEAVFDTRTGMLRSARMRIDKELTGHHGEGSSYRFQSSYIEEYVANP